MSVPAQELQSAFVISMHQEQQGASLDSLQMVLENVPQKSGPVPKLVDRFFKILTGECSPPRSPTQLPQTPT